MSGYSLGHGGVVRRTRVNVFCGCLSIILLAGTVGIWLVAAHEAWQSRNDRGLIAAIKRRDTYTAIKLLNHGANANALDAGPQLSR